MAENAAASTSSYAEVEDSGDKVKMAFPSENQVIYWNLFEIHLTLSVEYIYLHLFVIKCDRCFCLISSLQKVKVGLYELRIY